MPTDYLSPKERATINSIAQRYSSNPSVPKIDPVLEADMEDISKLVATIVGGKGDGKTAIALLFPGTTYALSYDHKTERIAKQLIRAGLKKPNEIFVANPMKYRFGNVDDRTAAGYLNTMETVKILGNIPYGKWDNICFDGTEIMLKQAELKMRYENNIPPNAGIANRSLWNDRRASIQRFYDMAYSRANVSVIFTAYWASSEEEVEEGGTTKTVAHKDPKWTDVIKYETDLLVSASHQVYGGKASFYAEIVTSKDDEFIKTGSNYNVSNYAPLISPAMIERCYPDLFKRSTMAGASQIVIEESPVQESIPASTPALTNINKDVESEWKL